MSNAFVSYVRSIGAALAVALCVVSSGRAAAQDFSAQALELYGPGVPSICSSKPQRAQKYQAGLTKGTQKADELFASSEIGKNPDKLRKKINRVLERLRDQVREAWRSESSDGRRCRVQGVTDGFLSRIVELIDQCILDGAQWGKFTAELYCTLSIELGGLGDGGVFVRGPVGLCGDLFQQTCDGVYSYVATEGKTKLPATVSRFCSDRGISVSPYAGCYPYTTGNYASIFASSRALDCTYAQ
jgi:ElaB/YqjD/DUF883 family membrane-anchored ribosome-binding protein